MREKLKKKMFITPFGWRQPAIILTAIDKLASTSNHCAFNSFVRLDNNELLRDTDKTIIAINKLFNLFINVKHLN
jgi:hypothetical protein